MARGDNGALEVLPLVHTCAMPASRSIWLQLSCSSEPRRSIDAIASSHRGQNCGLSHSLSAVASRCWSSWDSATKRCSERPSRMPTQGLRSSAQPPEFDTDLGIWVDWRPCG